MPTINRRRARKVQGLILGVGLCGVLAVKYFFGDLFSENRNASQNAKVNSALWDYSGSHILGQSEIAFKSRHLLYNLPNCTPPAVEHFPSALMTGDQRKNGGLVLHVFLTLYMFVALAIACDDYFVPSLEKISDALNLQSDVAGATFMAAGSSAPELATAVIGVFIAQDDIGLGAVVGSAIYNIMFVISVCALFAGAVVHLHWWPLFRDSMFYLISIVALTVSIYDEYIQWYEAWTLLLLYVVYIILMYFNPRLEKFMVAKFTCCPVKRDEEAHHLPVSNQNGGSSHQKIPLTRLDTGGSSDESDDIPEKESNGISVPLLNEITNGVDHYKVEVKTSEDEDEPDSPLSIPDRCYKKIMWIISLPLTICMFITVPDCRRKRWKRWYIVTFMMSLVWISLFSYLMVWMMTIIGYTLNIPDTVMALTFIAAGVSVPDAIASLIVVREGLGDMAVSNAIGSNVFDILLCLGLPWVLRTSVTEPGVPIRVYSAGLTFATITLLSTVVFLIAATHLNGWKLTKPYGVVLMFMYVIITGVSCLFELNVFGFMHPPTCPSSY